MQVRVYEKQRLAALRKLKSAVKNRTTPRMQTLIAGEIAKYESLQESCAHSIVKYQQGILTLEKLDQMRQTTTDFADITRMLGKMNKELNLRRTATMARNYERNMDIMEQKEETFSDLVVGRDEMDEASQSRARDYIQKARAEAGLDVEASLPSSSSAAPRVELTDDDQALISRVMGL